MAKSRRRFFDLPKLEPQSSNVRNRTCGAGSGLADQRNYRTHADSDSDSNRNCDNNSNRNCDSNSNRDRNSNGDCNGNANTYTDPDTYGLAYSYAHTNAVHWKMFTDTETASESGASVDAAPE